jgi:hypothetical protein
MAILINYVYDAAANLCGQLEPEYLGASGAEADEGARRQENGGYVNIITRVLFP